jgi:D-3-phosphoglycerate dehydrogenase / 2-oxoglutarate reductase
MKIVITDHRFPHVEQERRAVEAEGWQLVEGQETREEVVADLCRDADAVLSVRAPLSKRVIGRMVRCRVIVRYGIGVETVDLKAASDHGIMVANVPDYCVDEVSDHALALLLMLSRQTIAATSLAAEATWSTAKMPPLHRLRGQTCGLFGAGKIGSLLAAKVRALGMRALVYDPYFESERAKSLGIVKVGFEELLETSDHISLHAPLTSDTNHVFGQSAFARMKTTSFIVNTARGALIDEAALLAAIDGGQISGAGLDVLESETVVTPMRSALVRHPKVIVTAHTAWLSEEARATLQAKAIAQVISCLKGEKPYGLINREIEKIRTISG